MTAVGWIVYGGAVAAVVSVLSLLILTLQYVMSREADAGYAGGDHQARLQSENRGAAESASNAGNRSSTRLDIRPLPTAERSRFAHDWQSLQPLFVNDPERAVKEADRLISDVLQRRGYPVEQFANQSTDISAEYPDIVNHYREAHGVAQRAADGQATADDERHALSEYRELFDELLGESRTDTSRVQGVS